MARKIIGMGGWVEIKKIDKLKTCNNITAKAKGT